MKCDFNVIIALFVDTETNIMKIKFYNGNVI